MVQPFMKINRASVSNQVFDELKGRILSDEIASGEKLPSESVLAREFGVSRSSVRAAIQKLGTLGLVESKVGEGSFVRERTFGNLMGEVSALVAQESMTPFVTEFRDTVEAAATRLAVTHASRRELGEFVEMARVLVEVSGHDDLTQYVECDYDFHLQLCRLSQNPLFEMVYASIRDLFMLGIERNLEVTATEYADALAASAGMHLTFALALQSGDADASLQLIGSIVNDPLGRKLRTG
jgi:GntR family transcriptional repressor for pyruvate dehydrogenase complex